MRDLKVVKEGGGWLLVVTDGERVQRFHCATQAQAESLAKVMNPPEKAPATGQPGQPRPGR